MTVSITPGLVDTVIAAQSVDHRPLLFANARILTLDPLVGNFDRADVLLGGTRIVGIGPGLLSAADDDNAIVVDCDGLTIVPAVLDTTFLSGHRKARSNVTGGLAAGNPATFLVLHTTPDEPVDAIMSRILSYTAKVKMLVIDGRIVSETATSQEKEGAPAQSVSASPFLGTWIDESDFIHQHLSADGRYDETRGGREHAYQGHYWLQGNRIDYLDDLGFWAYGEFVDGVLHHAGYSFHRA